MSRGGYAPAVSATEGRVLPEFDAKRGLTTAQVAERITRGLTNDLPARVAPDKTGTLTENGMRLAEVCPLRRDVPVHDALAPWPPTPVPTQACRPSPRLTPGLRGGSYAAASRSPQLAGGAGRASIPSRVLRMALPAGAITAVATFTTYLLVVDRFGTTEAESRTAAVITLFLAALWVLAIVCRPYNG